MSSKIKMTLLTLIVASAAFGVTVVAQQPDRPTLEIVPTDNLAPQSQPTTPPVDSITRAIVGKQSAEEWTRTVRTKMERIEKHIAELDANKIDISKLNLTANELTELIVELRTAAIWLLDNKPEIQSSLRSLNQALKEAAAGQLAASEEYLRKKDAETIPVLKENYAALSKMSVRLSESFTKRAEALTETEAQLNDKLTFVAHSVEFLNTAERFVSHMTIDDDGAADEYVESLNAYLASFQDALTLFGELSNKLDEQGRSHQRD